MHFRELTEYLYEHNPRFQPSDQRYVHARLGDPDEYVFTGEPGTYGLREGERSTIGHSGPELRRTGGPQARLWGVRAVIGRGVGERCARGAQNRASGPTTRPDGLHDRHAYGIERWSVWCRLREWGRGHRRLSLPPTGRPACDLRPVVGLPLQPLRLCLIPHPFCSPGASRAFRGSGSPPWRHRTPCQRVAACGVAGHRPSTIACSSSSEARRRART